MIPADSSRRDFLVKCCQGASAAFIPAGLRGLTFPFAYASDSRNCQSGSDFHLHPHYRAQLPLEATLLKTRGGPGRFRHGKISRPDCRHPVGVERGLSGFAAGCARDRENSRTEFFRELHFAPLNRGWCAPARRLKSGKTNLPVSPPWRGTLFCGTCGPRWIRFQRSSPQNFR